MEIIVQLKNFENRNMKDMTSQELKLIKNPKKIY